MSDMRPNRLINETSPYLLQHAYNPVDWYPWGDEAFEVAVREDKPIFLSIGYSTCHWCHVMAHESFEDLEVAALLNEHFVCIKVDREERPDIDHTYMKVAQMMTGMGGWPLTIIMTPEKVPFFAATYIPKATRGRRVGLLSLLPALADAWKNNREKINEIVDSIRDSLAKRDGSGRGRVDADIFDRSLQYYSASFDPIYGGFGSSPKFPSPHNLMYLLRLWRHSGEESALSMVVTTLRKMREGGIFDQIGYGFHRYSTDSQWRLPHFEKMLYDQAMHIMAYTEAYQATGDDAFAQVVCEIVEYLERDMTDPNGGFYSAEDADSEGEEGKFYVWSYDEIQSILNEDETQVIVGMYDLRPEGNYEDEATRQRIGLNLLHVMRSPEALAYDLGMSSDDVKALWKSARDKMLSVRAKRIRPQRDEKILPDWNGLMIAALAKAGVVDKRFVELAERAMSVVLTDMMVDGRLAHGISRGQVLTPAFLDDYAFVIWGLIELYQATFDLKHLQKAIELHQLMWRLFGDDEGALYFTADDSEDLLTRDKIAYDGARPSGNSVAALNGVRLGSITGDETLTDAAERIISHFAQSINGNPLAYSMMLIAHYHIVGRSHEIVITGPFSEVNEAGDRIREVAFSNVSLVAKTSSGVDERLLAELVPFVSQYPAGDSLQIYVCVDQTCSPPTGDVDLVRDWLTNRD